MIKMPMNKAVKSKGMIAGVFMMGLGLYVVIEQKDVTGGMAVMGLGLGILGIRDDKQA